MNTLGRPLLALSMVTILAGCATTSSTGSNSTAQNPVDPFEKFNRTMFTFNDKVDQYALKPAAIAYKRVVPSFMQTGV